MAKTSKLFEYGLEAAINVPKMENFIKRMQHQVANLDFEGKRLALDMLDITVWLDHENLEITGVIPTEDVVIANTPSPL